MERMSIATKATERAVKMNHKRITPLSKIPHPVRSDSSPHKFRSRLAANRKCPYSKKLCNFEQFKTWLIADNVYRQG